MAHSNIFKNFIKGERVESASGQTFENRNLANVDELFGVFQKSTAVEVNAATEAAANAY